MAEFRIAPGPCAVALGRILAAAKARPLPVDAASAGLARQAQAERRWRRRARAFVRAGITPEREAAIRAVIAGGADVLDAASATGASVSTVRRVQKAMVRDRAALELLRAIGSEISRDG